MPARLSTELVERYRALAVRYWELGDVRKANRAYEQLVQVRRELHAAGESASRRLMGLLDDEHAGVRYLAAFEALSLEPAKGLRVLRELAAGPPGEIRADARRTIESYERGTMDLRPWLQVRQDQDPEP